MNAIIPSNNENARQPVDLLTLIPMIDAILIDWTNNNQIFTAYAVTLQLRQDNPTLEINHDDVRAYVHDTMNRMHTYGKLAYDIQYQDWNGQQARTYIPTSGTGQVVGVLQSVTITVTRPADAQLPGGNIIIWNNEEGEETES